MCFKKIGFIFILTLLTGCSVQNKDNLQEENKIKVFTTVNAIYDFTSKIGEDKIILKRIMPLGSDVHDWEPSIKDKIDLESADIVFYNGAGLEPWLPKLMDTIENKEIVFVDLSKNIIKLNEIESLSDEHEEIDSHFWLNPKNAKIQITDIAYVLSTYDHVNENHYLANLSLYSEKIDALDKKYELELENIQTEKFIVYHSAYSYLADRYNLIQLALDGITDGGEPTPSVMVSIVKTIRDDEIKYIFYGNATDKKIMDTIVKEVSDASTLPLNSFEGDMDITLGGENEYFSVMEKNLESLKKLRK
jgi:zinc transport system substrate-binding protein